MLVFLVFIDYKFQNNKFTHTHLTGKLNQWSVKIIIFWALRLYNSFGERLFVGS